MNRLTTEIIIPAPPEQVWSILTDFPAYPRWSPAIPHIGGDLTPGARLTLRIMTPGGRPVTVRPTVLAVTPARLLRWDAVLLHPRLLSGTHEFLLEDHPRGTRLQHSDTYTGLLAPLLRRPLAANEPLMHAQNTALHDRVRTLHADR